MGQSLADVSTAGWARSVRALCPFMGVLEGHIMDKLNTLAPSERWWVNVNEQRDLEYWMEKLGATEEEIRQAVAVVGVSVSAIKRQLNK